LDELLSNREVIATKILAIVDEATQAWGVKVMRIEIKDVSPPAELVEAMSQQMIAERTKRALITEAEGIRESDIKKAEGEKKSAILTAEGERQAAFLAAEARERSAEAEAKATAVVSKAVAEGDIQALNYFIAQKYVDAISKFGESPNEKLVFMPLESSSIIGAIGGISKLFEAGDAAATAPGTIK
ncbi:MAG: SPFH/Band 7/PHB domain protein, partial [Gammaproteobacteria bacterium]|nr:SPFH/Band 7/PHB domain protein [Gammaproteobacteria bacterium]